MEITVIQNENQEYFQPLMPEYLWGEADIAIGAIEEGTACGILALTERDTVLTITYLYVAQDYRRKGIASALLDGLHSLGRRGNMDMSVCQLASSDDMAGLEKCLEKNLFEKDDLCNPIYKVKLGNVSQKFMGRRPRGQHAVPVPLTEVPIRVWNQFMDELKKLPNRDGTVPELDAKQRYDQEASFLLIRQGEAAGCILLDKNEEDYILSYFCVLGKAAPTEMMYLFSASYDVLQSRCSGETEIYINTLTEAAEKMVLAMTDRKAQQVGQAVTWYSLY